MRGETIVGHNFNRKNDNNLIIILVILLIIVLFVSLKFIEKTSTLSGSEKKASKPSVQKSAEATPQKTAETIKKETQQEAVQKGVFNAEVLEKATCRQIVGNLPQSLAESFGTGERVNFYTKIAPDKIPLSLRHVWVNPNGEIYYSIDLHAYVKPASDVWSYVVIPPGNEGEWTVQVAVEQNIIDSKTFIVE